MTKMSKTGSAVSVQVEHVHLQSSVWNLDHIDQVDTRCLLTDVHKMWFRVLRQARSAVKMFNITVKCP